MAIYSDTMKYHIEQVTLLSSPRAWTKKPVVCYLYADDVQSNIFFLTFPHDIWHQLFEAWHISFWLYKQLLIIKMVENGQTEILFISWSCLTVCDLCCFFFFWWNYIFPLKCCFYFLPLLFPLHIALYIHKIRYCIIGVLLKSKKRTCTFIMAEVDLFSSANITDSHHQFKNLMEINYVLDRICS